MWWPLAASWALMGIEQPILTAVVARLDDPTVQLAAWGGIVFPVSLLIESPIIMLLAASTALCRDRQSYRQLRRFTDVSGVLLTLLHFAVAFTPLYDALLIPALGSPEAIREPGRLGLRLMLPWTWSIAYRRFHQGLLIRAGHSRAVGLGTAVRLISDVTVLAVGHQLGWPGVVVGASGLATGVVCEALYTWWRVRPVRAALPEAPGAEVLRGAAFARFYAPLAMTSLLHLLAEPVGAAALARMPRAIDSLAVWPALFGLVWVAMGVGTAYHEVVVSLLPHPEGAARLRRFTTRMALAIGAPGLLLAATPLGAAWFGHVAALPAELTALAARGLWLALPLPVLTAVHSWYQGVLVHARTTRAIPESLALFLVTMSGVAFAGVLWSGAPGLYVGLIAISLGAVVQAAWLQLRSTGVRRSLATDAPGEAVPAADAREPGRTEGPRRV